jgi:hypothetical protein
LARAVIEDTELGDVWDTPWTKVHPSLCDSQYAKGWNTNLSIHPHVVLPKLLGPNACLCGPSWNLWLSMVCQALHIPRPQSVAKSHFHVPPCLFLAHFGTLHGPCIHISIQYSIQWDPISTQALRLFGALHLRTMHHTPLWSIKVPYLETFKWTPLNMRWDV